MLKVKKGITLISLIVTIIVLLIISAVIIATLTQEDKNVIEESREIKEATEVAQEKEILTNILIEIDNRVFSGTPQEITDAKRLYIQDALTNEGVTNFEVNDTSVNIGKRTYNYSDLLPGFSSI